MENVTVEVSFRVRYLLSEEDEHYLGLPTTSHRLVLEVNQWFANTG